MNLSRDWQADWGGLLHFVDGPNMLATLTPNYNSLCVFRVPQDHCVSQVASYARSGALLDNRLAFCLSFGWGQIKLQRLLSKL